MSKDVKQNTPSVDKSESNVNSLQQQSTPQSPDSGSIDRQSINGGAVQSGRELRMQLAKELIALPVGSNKPLCWDMEVLLDYIEQLIAARLRAQLDEVLAEGPEKYSIASHKIIGDGTGYYHDVGFNTACDQWRTLLAKKRDTEGV